MVICSVSRKTPEVAKESILWVGAWWLPTLILGSISFIASFAYFKIPDQYQNTSNLAVVVSKNLLARVYFDFMKLMPFKVENCSLWSKIQTLITNKAWIIAAFGLGKVL